MSYEINYSHPSSPTLEPPQSLESPGYIEGEDEFFFEEEPIPAEQSTYTAQPVKLTMNQVRGRLSSLAALVEQSELGEEEQGELLKEIKALQNRLNFACSLNPEARGTELQRLYQEVGPLEAQFISGTPAKGGEEKTSDQSLQERHDDLKKQITKLEAKGWISEDLREKLKQKLDRVTDLIGDEDLGDAAADMIEELEGNLDSIKEMYVEEGDTVEALKGESVEVENGSLDALLQLSSVSEEQAMAAFKAAFPSSSISSAGDLAEAIEKEEAPFTSPPSAEVIKFLEGIDAEFGQAIASSNRWVHTALGANYQKAATRLNALLNAVYGDDHIIRVTQPETQNGYQDWRLLNEITFDGVSYSFTREEKGQTNRVAWAVLDASSKPAPASSGGSGGSGLPGVPNVPGPGDEIANKGKSYVEDGKDWVADKLGIDSPF